MVKVCFKNTLDEAEEFEKIEAEGIIRATHEYARTKDLNIYRTIMQEKVNIYLNGELVKVDDWFVTELSEDDEIIITPAIEGDDAAGVLQIVAGIVLIVVGWWNPAGWKIGSSLIVAGIGLVLGGVSQLLFQPDLPILPSFSSGKGASETQTYNWSGIKTTAQLDSPVPVVIGTHAVGGNIISLFTESIGNDNYLYMLLALSEGEIEGICQEKDYTQVCSTSDTTDSSYKDPAIFLDDQPLRNYDEVRWWYRTGTNLPDGAQDEYYPFAQNVVPNFASSRIQYDDGRELDSDIGWLTYTSTKEVDFLMAKLEAPALYHINEETGDIESCEFTYEIQWRKTGDPTWTSATGVKYEAAVSSTNTNTEYCGVSYSHLETDIGFKPNTYTLRIMDKYEENLGDSYVEYYGGVIREKNTTTNLILKIAIYDEEDNLIKEVKSSGYTQIVTSLNTLIGQEIVTTSSGSPSIYIDGYTVTFNFNGVAEGSEFTIYAINAGNVSEFTVTGKTKTGKQEAFTINFNEVSDGRDFYEMRIRRTDGGPSDSFRTENRVVLKSVTEVVQGKFIYPNTALLGFKIKATGQLSGSPPNVVTTLKGIKVQVPDLEDASPSGTDVTFENAFWDVDNARWEDYDGNEIYWNNTSSWRKEYTENPMCHARNLLINKRYGVGKYITKSNINNTDIITGIKECHKEYYAIGYDFLSWWDNGNNDAWADNWSIIFSNPPLSDYDISLDSSSRYIDIPGTAGITYYPHIMFNLKLTGSLRRGQKYTLSIDLSNVSNKIDKIDVFGGYQESSYHGGYIDTIKEHLGYITNITSDGTYTLTVYPKITCSSISIFFAGGFSDNYCYQAILDFRIDDISLVKGNAPAGDPIDVTGEGGKEHFHTFNGVLESDKSALVGLVEMCESFRCWPTWYNGTFGFIMDIDSTPVHTLTMGNTKSFKQEFIPISEIPYRLIGQYTDESISFNMRSIMIKSSATNINKTNERIIGMKGLTDFNRVARELRWKMDVVENCNRIIELNCDVDAIHCTAGDIIYFQDDLPQWGQGGRILDFTATNITVDKKYTFTNVATDAHVVRYQDSDNYFNTATVDHTHVSNNASLQIIPIENLTASPCSDSAYFLGVPTSDLKKFRVLSLSRNEENSVNMIAREHVSSIYTSPSFEVAEVYKKTMPNVLDKPLPLESVVITSLSPFEGKGFNIGVKLDPNDSLTKEVVVQLDKTGTTNFETINILSIEQTQYKYVDNSLNFDRNYTFRIFGRSQFKQSTPTDITVSLKKSLYSGYINPPSGLSIKDSNTSNFKSKDVTIVWNATGSSMYTITNIVGYKVEVLYENNNSSILRTDFVSDTKYTYTLEMNEEDCARLNLDQSSYSTFYFRVYTVAGDNILSSAYSLLKVINTVPLTVSGLEAESMVGGARFSWTKSTELDHKNYTFRTLVGSGSWSSWKNTENSIVAKSLTATDISSYGSRSSIHFEVKDVDWYDQQSNVASVTASANRISDNIYQLTPSVSGGSSGNVASLLDGVTDSGGLTVT